MHKAIKTAIIMAALTVSAVTWTTQSRSDPLAALWKGDGTEYTIKDKVIIIDRYWGGQAASIVQVSFWRALGWTMEINGDCYSNCSFIAEKLPTCIRDGAKMGYHMSYDRAKNIWIDNRSDFRPLLVAAVEAKGGFPKSSNKITVLSGDELVPFFEKCPHPD